MTKWLWRGFIALAPLVGVVLLVGYVWLRTSLPQIDGSIAIAGIEAPVEIGRDEDGIVTIRAANEAGAYFGLGFAHAQDRLFQMDMMRRLGAGRLSEAIGEATVGIDRSMRVLGLYRLAEGDVERLAPEIRAALQAYTDGVNAFLSQRSGALPPEFILLGYRPEPWRPADSLVWARLVGWQLGTNWREELLRYRLSQRLTPAQLESLWPASGPSGSAQVGPLDRAAGPSSVAPPLLPSSFRRKPESMAQQLDARSRNALAIGAKQAWTPAFAGVTTEGDGAYEQRAGIAALGGLARSLPAWSALIEQPGASNSWAVSGTRTKSGKPLLANDPHLPLTAPIQWYLARMEAPGLTLAGGTVPGVPFMIIGHNARVAWGFTATQGDTQDLFIEHVASGDPSRYDTPDGPRPFVTRDETIKIRGAPDLEIAVRTTRHGPVISDAGMTEAALPESVVALASAALVEEDPTAGALYRMNHATDAASFHAALEDFHSPQLNVVYADAAGRIGFQLAGLAPLRRTVFGGGQMPAPGWSGDYDWIGQVPFAQLPQSLDPPSGWVGTANNRTSGADYPYFLGARWDWPYRIRRIAGLLEDARGLTAADMQKMQMDDVSLFARDTVPVLLAEVAATRPRSAAALQLMDHWDFRMDRDRPEPLIFTAWLSELLRLIYADELGTLFDEYPASSPEQLADLLSDPRSPWCDDIGTAAIETCEERVRLAFERAVDQLAASHGSEPANWRWGKAHRAELVHPLFGRIAILRGLVDPSIETSGDNDTIDRGTAAREESPLAFRHLHGAGMRAVLDLADLDASRFIVATGQSGNPLSPHFDDLVRRWRDGELTTIVGRDRHVLTLQPAAGGRSG